MMEAAPMAPQLLVRVAQRREEALGIASFELRALDGGQLPPFTAGAHIDVQAPNGIVRQYSICSSPLERERYLLGILDDPASRGGSPTTCCASAPRATISRWFPPGAACSWAAASASRRCWRWRRNWRRKGATSSCTTAPARASARPSST
jgi:hypothetical protein